MTPLCRNCGERPRRTYAGRVQSTRCGPCDGWYWRHQVERPPLPVRVLRRGTPGLCSNCGTRPQLTVKGRIRAKRCGPCAAWFSSHQVERPPLPVRARPGSVRACRTCPETDGPFTQGECRACYCYRWRTGAERPAYLTTGAPRHCEHCQAVVGPRDGRRCAACRQYRSVTGRERPAHLWHRPRQKRRVAA